MNSVTVVGLTTTFSGRNVLLVCLVQVDGQTVTVRTKTGFLLPAGAAEHGGAR